MSHKVVCLAIVGNTNEPLYLCTDRDDKDTRSIAEGDETVQDCFGFSNREWQIQSRTTVPIRLELMIHCALDRLEEVLGSSKHNTLARWQRGSHWIGMICTMEDNEIYGYVTASNIKILAMLQKPSILSLKKTKEVEIKVLFAKVHECYVKYTLNPFTKIRSRIEGPCHEFEASVRNAIDAYNATVQQTPGLTVSTATN